MGFSFPDITLPPTLVEEAHNIPLPFGEAIRRSLLERGSSSQNKKRLAAKEYRLAAYQAVGAPPYIISREQHKIEMLRGQIGAGFDFREIIKTTYVVQNLAKILETAGLEVSGEDPSMSALLSHDVRHEIDAINRLSPEFCEGKIIQTACRYLLECLFKPLDYLVGRNMPEKDQITFAAARKLEVVLSEEFEHLSDTPGQALVEAKKWMKRHDQDYSYEAARALCNILQVKLCSAFAIDPKLDPEEEEIE